MLDFPTPPPAVYIQAPLIYRERLIDDHRAEEHVHQHPEDIPTPHAIASLPSRLLLETGDFLLLERNGVAVGRLVLDPPPHDARVAR